MAAAKENNMYVVGHIPMDIGLEGALSSGMDGIAHAIPILFWELTHVYTPGMMRNEFMPAWQQKYPAQWDGVDPETWYAREKENIAKIVEIIRSNGVNICTTGVGPEITLFSI